MHPILEVLCATYIELCKREQIPFPLHPKQAAAIDAIVKTVNANYFGVERFVTPADKAVAYLCFIIKDHPVTDGNKRLAVLWFRIYCNVQKLQPNITYTFDVLAVAIEQSDLNMDELMKVVKDILFSFADLLINYKE